MCIAQIKSLGCDLSGRLCCDDLHYPVNFEISRNMEKIVTSGMYKNREELNECGFLVLCSHNSRLH